MLRRILRHAYMTWHKFTVNLKKITKKLNKIKIKKCNLRKLKKIKKLNKIKIKKINKIKIKKKLN